MESRKQIRTRMAATRSAQQFTRAMKLMSATRLRRATDAIIRFRPYADRMQALMGTLQPLLEEEAFKHYFHARPPEKVALVLVTSDRGLCGAFNALIVRRALSTAHTQYATQFARGDVTLMSIGRKGIQHLRRNGFTGDARFVAAQRISSLAGAREVAAHLTAAFEAGELDRVEVIYHRFKNVATQILTHEVMLPVQPTPVKAPTLDPGDEELCFFEPDENAIVGHLIARCVEVQLHRALLESQAAELCARMMAMDKANENAETLLRELTQSYNQARQAAITREIAEILGGRLDG